MKGRATLLTLCVWVAALGVRGQETTQASEPAEPPAPQLFTDERAGYHIDNLSRRGIQTLLKWRHQFLESLSELNNTLNFVETTLEDHYAEDVMPNLTAVAMEMLEGVSDKLDTAQALADSLGLVNEGDGLVAFMKSGDTVVNVAGAYDPNNRAGGTFTAPQAGLYQVTVRTGVGYNVEVDVNLNGDTTLSSLISGGYYDVRTRIRVVWLEEGDEVFTTGSTPLTFGVMLLRVQELMPSSM